MRQTLLALLLGVVLYSGGAPALALTPAAADTGAVGDLNRHDPYDLSQIAEVDSNDVYASRTNYLLSFPRHLWRVMVYPLVNFTIYAEHARLVTRYYRFFVNDAGTFGVFPQVQLPHPGHVERLPLPG